MASGDDLVCGERNGASDRTTLVGQKSRPSKDFTSDTIFLVAPASVGSGFSPDRDVDAVRGVGNRGGRGIIGVGGFQDRSGPDRGASGVFGAGGGVGVGKAGGTGVVGVGSRGSLNEGGIGVMGFGGAGDGQFRGGPGVFGTSDTMSGVVGTSQADTMSGVFGYSFRTTGDVSGVLGRCDSPDGSGVSGYSLKGAGVTGFSNGQIGVSGESNAHIGVYGFAPHLGMQAEGGDAAILGFSPNGHGVIGLAQTRGKFAGAFVGNVLVAGSITVLGAKSAAVRTGKNSYARFYSVESPESWFEDFGDAQLRSGRAVVRVPRDFARFIRTGRYHVFVTPTGLCAGLAVTRRTPKEFEIRELNGGKSSVRFSYRIVAKRADIAGKRLEKVIVEKLPEPRAIDKRRTALSKRDLPQRPRVEIVPKLAGVAPLKDN